MTLISKEDVQKILDQNTRSNHNDDEKESYYQDGYNQAICDTLIEMESIPQYNPEELRKKYRLIKEINTIRGVHKIGTEVFIHLNSHIGCGFQFPIVHIAEINGII